LDGTRARARRGALHLALLIAGAAIGGGTAARQGRALAAPREPPRAAAALAEVEVAESAATGPRTFRAALGLVGNEPASLSASAGTASYRLRLQRDDRGLHLDLERSERGAGRVASGASGGGVKLQAAVPAAAGRRVVIGRLVRPDGSKLEVSATLRQ
jgi:hypothetical protein